MNHQLRINHCFLIFALFFICACGKTGSNHNDNSASNDSAATINENIESKETAEESDEKIIMFFGNSLTAGYGVDPGEAFPAIIQQKVDSLGLQYEIINAGLSGETTASGENRVEWILKQKVDIFILELGANDGLRGIDLKETKENLQGIIDKVEETYPDARIVLTGMQIPPSMGPEYAARFREIFPELAEENDIDLIPFLLQGVGGEPALNLPDGIHPNEEGHKILAENVWSVLKGMI